MENNVLILNPVYYGIISKHLITNKSEGLELIKYISLLVFQSIGYYYIHFAMHNIRLLRKIHKFHHRFTDVLIPSIGISVTISEYSLAYAFPFLVGSWIINTNMTTLSWAVCTVSLLNIMIHCKELTHLKYYKCFVSPADHFIHHRNIPNRNTYAAPFINIDNLIDHLDNETVSIE